MGLNTAADGIPEQPERSEEPKATPDILGPKESIEDEQQETGETLRRLLETHEGQEKVFELIRGGDLSEELFELTPEEQRVFESRWKDGFLRQVMLGEFDLERPLSAAEKAELLTTQDPRRMWLLQTRKRLSRKKKRGQ